MYQIHINQLSIEYAATHILKLNVTSIVKISIKDNDL